MFRLAYLPVILVVLVACGPDASGTPSAADADVPETAAPASAAPASAVPSEAPADCIATPESGASIADGLTVEGGGTLRNAFAVALAPGLDFGFVVAAEIDGPGMEGDGEIGTWAVGELGSGPIIAANSMAQEFSEWGAAASDGSPMDAARDAVADSAEAAAAEACASAG